MVTSAPRSSSVTASVPGVGGVPSFVQARGLVGSFREVGGAWSDLCDQPLRTDVLSHPEVTPASRRSGMTKWLSGMSRSTHTPWTLGGRSQRSDYPLTQPNSEAYEHLSLEDLTCPWRT